MCGNMWPACITRHSTALKIGLAVSTGLVYLWSAGYEIRTISALSLILLGIVYWYYQLCVQEKLNSKHLIVITGCDSGLGYSLALHCQALGATVLAGMLDPDGQAAKNLTDSKVIVHHLDITNEGSIEQFGKYVETLCIEKKHAHTAQDLLGTSQRCPEDVLRTYFGHLLDICAVRKDLYALINNAGVMIFGEFDWQTEQHVKRQIGVNLIGTMRVTQLLMSVILSNKSRIIVISSHCAEEFLPSLSVYCATKAALRAWSISLRVELAKYDVKVISFIPGNFTRESNIMARQRQYFNEMERSMRPEGIIFYDDYFARYVEYYSFVAGQNDLKRVTNPNIYDIFDNALLDVYPSAVYKCEPWKYFFYYTSFRYTPTCLRDRLINRFVKTPSWRKPIIEP